MNNVIGRCRIYEYPQIRRPTPNTVYLLVIALHNGMYKKQYHNNFPIMVDVVAPDSGYSTLRKHTEHRLSCAVELFGICKLYNFVVESSTRAKNWLNVRVGVSTCTIVVFCGVVPREPNKRRISKWNLA